MHKTSGANMCKTNNIFFGKKKTLANLPLVFRENLVYNEAVQEKRTHGRTGRDSPP